MRRQCSLTCRHEAITPPRAHTCTRTQQGEVMRLHPWRGQASPARPLTGWPPAHCPTQKSPFPLSYNRKQTFSRKKAQEESPLKRI